MGLRLRAIALLFALPAGVRAAEEPARFSAERLRPALSRDGILDVETGAVTEHLDADAALWVGYANEPMALYRRGDDDTLERVGALVGPRLGANLVLSLGLLNWLQLGLDVPVVVFQARGALPADLPIGALTPGGLGDVRFSPKIQMLRAADHGLDLAFMPTLTAPTSVPRGDYLGEKFFTFAPEILVSRDLAGVRLAGDLGYRARSISRFGGIIAGHEVFFRAGMAIPLADIGIPLPLELDASLHGSVGVLPEVSGSPLEVLLGGRYSVTEEIKVFAAAGAGLIGAPTVPDFRVLTGIQWAPHLGDADRDGIDDGVDGCPNDPEDRDGNGDNDGCPETDLDSDTLLDETDHCPAAAEDQDGFEDNDGCPDPDDDDDGIADAADRCPRQPGDPEFQGCRPPDTDHDRIADHLDKCPTEAGRGSADGCPPVTGHPTRRPLEIGEKFQFAFDSDQLLAASGPLCDRIAQQLAEHPDAAISIEGHTDDSGFHAYNLKLSQRRATAVRNALVARGVLPERIDVVGFGAGRPLVEGVSEAARAQNRRVEIIVVQSP